PRGATCIFLGLDEARPYFAVDGGPAEAAVAGQPGPIDARTLAPLLSGGEAAILAEARSLIDWHARHRFCAQCGSPTRIESAGWVRRCPECKASHYPRSDPLSIMLVARAASGPDDPTQVSVPGPVAIAHHICRRWSNGLDTL